MQLLLDLARERIGNDDVRFVAVDVFARGSIYDPVSVLSVVLSQRDFIARGTRRNVKQPRFWAVRCRPEIAATIVGWTQLLGAVRERLILQTRVYLDVLVGIVVDRQSSLLVDAFRPIYRLHVGLGEQGLAVGALKCVQEPVAR